MEQDSAQEFFRDEVKSYRLEHYESGYRTFMTVRQDCFLAEIDKLKLPAGAKVLDAGCGPGLLSREMVDRDFNVSSVDTSDAMLSIAADLYGDDSNRPEFKLGSIEELPYEDANFDMVASAGVIEYLKTDTVAVGEFHRVLKSGGYLLLSITNGSSPVGIFEILIEALKRNKNTLAICNFILTRMGRTPVRPREFDVRKHYPKTFEEGIKSCGFEISSSGYFYMLPWPHPFDRLFPNLNSALNVKLECLASSSLGFLSEGFYVLAKKSN
jgi:ubiquinone/menaquinone biosynthesis C-methylase UbiE